MHDRLLKRACYTTFFSDFESNPVKNWELCVSDKGLPYLWNHISYPDGETFVKAKAQVVNATMIDVFFIDLDLMEALGILSGESHGVFAVPGEVVIQICFGLIGEEIEKINKKSIPQLGA